MNDYILHRGRGIVLISLSYGKLFYVLAFIKTQIHRKQSQILNFSLQ